MSTEPTATERARSYLIGGLACLGLSVPVWLVLFVNIDQQGLSSLILTILFFIILAQFVLGVLTLVWSIRALRREKGPVGPNFAGAFLILAAPVQAILALFTWGLPYLGGGAWGRPLRVRGRQLHPELRGGTDWTLGARPDPAGLDPATRRALEALWLHDAQKEHASVPAFSRISWILAALGAPAELLEGAHRAALEEIDHTRRCFALAAGYAGRSHSV